MPVQADAVDASDFGPVHSFLPPGANTAAQALLADPTLRGMRAEQLARILNVKVTEACAGIASIIGLINAVAHGSPDAALVANPSLSGAVGPYMSLDQAMSRFGSHMGPIVSSPRPLSAMAQPDYAPDRELGAGRAGAPRGRGHFSGPERNMDDYGEAGDISANLDSAAHAMIDYLHFQGCGPDATIGDFQDTYNHEFAPPVPLAVDNKYSTKTHAALQAVIHASPASSDLAQATPPPACDYLHRTPAASPPGPGTYVAPTTIISGTPGKTPVSQASAGGSIFSSPWTWALLLAGAGAVVISRSKHPPKWARDIGLHR